MRALTLIGTASLAMMSSSIPAADPAVRLIETVGATGLQGRVGTPFLMPGIAKEYWIYGPWVDYTSKVTLLGVEQTKLENNPLTPNGPMVKVRLKVPSGTTRGIRQLHIKISCLWGQELVSDCESVTLTQNIMVLQSGFVGSVSPSTGIPLNQQVSLEISGSNLLHAGIIAAKTMFTGTATSGHTNGSFRMTGTTKACGTAVIMVGDKAEGGAVYPYGTVSVKTNTACGYTPPPKTLGGSPCPPGQYWDQATTSCKTEE